MRRQAALIQQEQSASVATSMPLYKEGIRGGSSAEALEGELVKYLLKYGHLNFDLREGRTMVSCNVAEVIFDDLEADGLQFQNPLYNEILSTYRREWELLGSGVEVPAHHFVNHHDPEVSKLAVDLLASDDNYVASRIWTQKEIHVESEMEMLSAGVPRCMALYKSKVIERMVRELNDKLLDENLTEEQLSDILQRLSKLNVAKVQLAKKVDRLLL